MSNQSTDYYILHSGGLDSTVALSLAMEQPDVRNIIAVGVEYGQRHIVELEAARAVRQALGVPGVTLDLTGYGRSVQSALTTNQHLPTGSYNEDNMAATEVPGRNAVMLAAVAGMAASRSGNHPAVVVTAVHSGDHHLYRDCRPDFIHAISQALHLATGIEVKAPFVNMSKSEIVARGHALNAPLHLTWSCYAGGDKHCGECGTCRERRDAFHQAGIPDPTSYA